MANVEVEFSANSSKYDAKPGDTKKVPAEDVPEMLRSGVVKLVSKQEAKKAGVQ